MNWLSLEQMLVEGLPARVVALQPDMTHDVLRSRALSLAATLQARGVRRLALYLEDAGELAVALLGAWRAGVTVLLPADDQAHSRAQVTGAGDLWLDSLQDLELLAELPGAALDLDRCRLTLCTSGSTGAAKWIDKSLRQLSNELQCLEQLWGAELQGVTVLGSVATQHIYGLLFRLLWPLCAGRAFLRQATSFPEDLQRASLAQPSFVWIASPALLKRLGDNLDWAALAAVRRLFSSGGALPAEAAERLFGQLGQWPTEVYGSSETGGIAWRQGPCAWQPFAGVELAQSAEGALRLRSAFLPDDGWEQTADAVTLEGGGFHLRGRLDRLVKLEEQRISLPRLEQALLEHAWLADVRLGVVQEGRAALGALLVLSPAGVHALRNQGRRALTEALRRQLRDHCPAMALPRRWRLLSQLPCNSQGKLAQAEVEACLAAPRPTQPHCLSRREVDGEWQVELQVPLDLAHFSGHFAATPVLPGVVQIDWALSLARELLVLPPRFVGMEVLKFQQLARPGDQLSLSLRFDAGRSKLYFAYRAATGACSSGRILLGAADV